LLDRFRQTTEIDFKVFDASNAEVNSNLLVQRVDFDPEEAKKRILEGSLEDESEEENDGTGLLPESLKRT
jgi:hypothetical protein